MTWPDKQKSASGPAKKQKDEPKSKLSISSCPTALPGVPLLSARGGHDGLQAAICPHVADGHQELARSITCSSPFSAADFFKDCPWLGVPEHRKADIIIEPLYPRLGLLGGASTGGKMSKLAALAAKRKQEKSARSESATTDSADSQEDYATRLNKLRISDTNKTKPQAHRAAEEIVTNDDKPTSSDSKAPASDSHTTPAKESEVAASSDPSISVAPAIRGRPSAFASIMTSHHPSVRLSAPPPDLITVEEVAKSFDFTEPSPDDVVTRAQNQKGRPPI